MFSGGYYKFCKNTYFEVDLRTAASDIFQNYFPENLKGLFDLFCYIYTFRLCFMYEIILT